LERRKFVAMSEATHGVKGGEVVWITGGGSGIGLAIAKRLAAEGHRIAITGRTISKLEQASDEIKILAGSEVFTVVGDVSVANDVERCVSEIVEHFGESISLLVSSAGISPFTLFSETSVEEFDEVIAVNLKGGFLVAKAVLPGMYAAGRGTIVEILSIASEKAFKGGASYIASKFAMRGFTDSLREEARKHNVRVIAILPGATETELWDESERVEHHERMMQPEDVANVICDALKLSSRALIEEIRMRPIGGDL
jgi:3-oxoacyl-[acyl-carrier protein] reductase